MTSRRWKPWHCAALLACALAAVSGTAQQRAQSPRETEASRVGYAATVGRSYDWHFGSDVPFRPSNAQIEGGRFVPSGTFPTAAYCGHCHAGAYQQWKDSLHRNSFREPFYIKNVKLLDDTKGVEYSRHCEGCHNPVALFAGAVTQNSRVDRSFDDDGVTCSVCHSITKLQTMSGNGAYVMGIPAVMVDAHGKRIPGVVPDAQILAHPERHRQAVMQDFYRAPEFCGSCHKSTVPADLTDYKWYRGFGTYDEWQASAYSDRSPAPYYRKPPTTCQDCHMPREAAGAGEYGARDGTIASHRWLGGNTAVPFYYGLGDQLRQTMAFLEAQKLDVDIFALEGPSAGEWIAPLDEEAAQVEPGQKVTADVVIQNTGLGHSLIPEQRDFYEAWVEFTATDAGGQEFYDSGYVNADGTVDASAHSFTNRLVDKSGSLIADHEIWQRRAVAFDNTILPGRSTLVRYGFEVPRDARGPITLAARVRYRHFNQEYLDNVLGPGHPEYPIAEMASGSVKLEVAGTAASAGRQGAAPAQSAAKPRPEWLRWNNLGIALLEQQQYAEARRAFERVAQLRPDYADVYTNEAIAVLGLSDYAGAHALADRALSLARNAATNGANGAAICEARALYYRALIERNEEEGPERGLEASVRDLEQVVRAYPESREARRELGVSYYRAHRDGPARQTFEKLQANDPDDLLAHFYLAILYRRAGLTAKADEQTRLYDQKRPSPGEGALSLAFLRTHPEVREEYIPDHVHTGSSSASEAKSDHNR